MRGKSHGRTSLPSAALPASGSRGRPISRTSQPGGSPALIFFKIRPTRAKSICSHGLVARFSHAMAHSTVAIPIGGYRCEPHRHLPLQKMSIKRGASIAISLVPAVLCWCERSGAIRRSSFARSTRRCSCPRRLARPRCLPPSPCRSRVRCPHRS